MFCFKKTVLSLLLTLMALLSANAQDGITVCLYSPKLNIADYKKFKTDFDEYLSDYSRMTFQPFVSCTDFEKYIKENENFLAVMSGWHFKSFSSQRCLKKVLVGCNGTETQEQFYFISNKNSDFSTSKEIHIATALDLGFAGDIISRNNQFSKTLQKSSLRVPKDIDALMSLSLNVFHVDVALVSGDVYDYYKKRYPVYAADLKSTPSGIRAPLMVVAVTENASQALVKRTSALLEMSRNKSGKKLLAVLSLDAWKKPKKLTAKKLTAKEAGTVNEK